MKIVFILLGSIAGLALVGLLVLGALAPETFIYKGSQVPEKYLNTARELKVLQADEKVIYFYSDALMDIKEGFYMLTDKSLVIYCEEWEEPAEIIPLADIIKVKPRYDDSFLEDSLIHIETIDGSKFSFPLSSEKGLDKDFVAAIRSRITAP